MTPLPIFKEMEINSLESRGGNCISMHFYTSTGSRSEECSTSLAKGEPPLSLPVLIHKDNVYEKQPMDFDERLWLSLEIPC